MKRIVLKTINLYKKLTTPVFEKHCRFYPSCSDYTAQVIEKYGLLKGLSKGFWRILKCNPLNRGGVDLP